jgi:hypothetical protein
MRVLLYCLVAIRGFVYAAGIPAISHPSVTVILEFEKPHSDVSFQVMREEVQRLLGPAGIQVDFRLKRDVTPGAEFPDLVLFKMRGSCTISGWTPERSAIQRRPLAVAYSDRGQVLHFGEVACDPIRESLETVLGPGSSGKYQYALGNALGLVIAHELYHMLADTAVHTNQGVTKEALSSRELLAAELTLPEVAREALHRAAH